MAKPSLGVAPTLLLLLGGCGSGGLGIDDLPAQAERAECERLVRCDFFPDLATCEEATSIAESPVFAELSAAVDRGTVTYDGDKAEECLALIDMTGCALDELGDPAVCDEIFVGQVADGGACLLDVECVSGACGPPIGGCMEACCMGACNPTFQEPPVVPVGAECSSAVCESGTYCDFGATPPICTAQAGAGEACASLMGHCQGGLYCVLDLATGQGTCEPAAAEGEACDPMASFGSCDRVDLYCAPTTSTCSQRTDVGGSCADGLRCVEYALCDTTSSICVAVPGLDEPCPDGRCLGTLQCTAGTCILPTFDPPCL